MDDEKLAETHGELNTNLESEPENLDVVMDPDGDLILRVGTELTDSGASPRNFRVDSGTLRRMSPVFKVMLFGGWAESKPKDGSDWVVTLPEDRPTGLEVVLASSHSRYELLPKRPMNRALLLDILIVCDKYQMLDVILPWLGCWKRDVHENRKCYCDGVDMARIAWLSGDETELLPEVGRLIMRTKRSKPAASLILDFGPGADELPWADVIDGLGFGSSDWDELVAAGRVSIIRDILNFVRNQIKSLVSLKSSSGLYRGSNVVCLSYLSSCDRAIAGNIPWPDQGLENVDKNKSTLNMISHMLAYYGADAASLDGEITPISLINVFRRALSPFEAPKDHRSCSPSARFESFVGDGSWAKKVGEQVLRDIDKTRMSDIRERIQRTVERQCESQSQAKDYVRSTGDVTHCYRCYSMGF